MKIYYKIISLMAGIIIIGGMQLWFSLEWNQWGKYTGIIGFMLIGWILGDWVRFKEK